MKWHRNITVKMLGYLLVASMVPLVLLGLTAFEISKRVVIELAEDESARLLGSFSSYLRLYNDQVDDMAANIAGNEAIGETLRQSDTQTLTGIDDLKMRAQMGRILNSYVRVKGLVSIDIFSHNGQHFHVGETLNVSKVNAALTKNLLSQALASPTATLWRGVDENLNRCRRLRTSKDERPAGVGEKVIRAAGDPFLVEPRLCFRECPENCGEVRIIGLPGNHQSKPPREFPKIGHFAAEPVVGHPAGDRVVVLDHIQAVHRSPLLVGVPPGGESGGIPDPRLDRIQKVAVEREYDVRHFKLRQQARPRTECGRCGGLRLAVAQRFVFRPE